MEKKQTSKNPMIKARGLLQNPREKMFVCFYSLKDVVDLKVFDIFLGLSTGIFFESEKKLLGFDGKMHIKYKIRFIFLSTLKNIGLHTRDRIV